jgi:hypothetical protein
VYVSRQEPPIVGELDHDGLRGYHRGLGKERILDERDVERARNASEDLDRLTRESYKAAVDRAFDAQKSGMRLSRRFFENWVETLEDQAELNRRALGNLQELVREQREVFRTLSRESVDAYDGFLDSLDAYEEDISRFENRED